MPEALDSLESFWKWNFHRFVEDNGHDNLRGIPKTALNIHPLEWSLS